MRTLAEDLRPGDVIVFGGASWLLLGCIRSRGVLTDVIQLAFLQSPDSIVGETMLSCKNFVEAIRLTS